MASQAPDAPAADARRGRALFEPVTIAGLRLPNRVVMAPMTRGFAPGGIVTGDNIAYYRRRALGGVGLIITEGTWIGHPAAGDDRGIPRLYGEAALSAWSRLVAAVHDAGSRIFAQLWHQGMMRPLRVAEATGVASLSPSGYVVDGVTVARAMTADDIEAVVDAYASAAVNARSAGFDGVEVHGAHGYLLDQFLWERTNTRTDAYGGSVRNRTRLVCEVVAEIKRRAGADFPVSLRLSQWKQIDYAARLAGSAAEWAALLEPITASGVDVFHVSTRHYADPAFPGSGLPLAGVTRRVTGKPVITVGSVGLSKAKEEVGWEKDEALAVSTVQTTDDIERRLAAGEFDLVAVGRALLANPAWASKVRADRLDELEPYTLAARAILR